MATMDVPGEGYGGFLSGFITPADNIQLSDADYATALDTIERIKAVRRDREKFLIEQGLDRETLMPAHLWAAKFVQWHFDKIASGDRKTLNLLRLYCAKFTGFRLIDFTFGFDDPDALITSIPEVLDESLRRFAPTRPAYLLDLIADFRIAPDGLLARAPRMFGEAGWEFAGYILNYDVWATQKRLNALHTAGIIERIRDRFRKTGSCRIVEIGAGYGGLAYALKWIFPEISYVIVDLPESLVFSAVYLRTLLGAERQKVVLPFGEAAESLSDYNTVLLANYLAEARLQDLGPVDIALNFLSLTEMSAPQVAAYGRLLSRMLGREGVFLEQNYHVPDVHTDARTILRSAFPYHRAVQDGALSHSGRGEVFVWANSYLPSIFDCSDFGAFADFKEGRPRLTGSPIVFESYCGYNLVGFRGTLMAVDQALGAVDVTKMSDREAAPFLLLGRTVAELRLRAENMRLLAQQPAELVKRYEGYDILRARGRLVAVEGALSRFYPRDVEPREIFPKVLVGDQISTLRKRISELNKGGGA